MAMEQHAARSRSGHEQRREIGEFYEERQTGAGLYAEVSHHEERRVIPSGAPEEGE